MFPGSEGTMANYLKDIASVPASAIAEVESDVRQQLAVGEIGLGDIGDAIQEGLEDYALGLPPRMKRAPNQRGPRTHVKKGSGQKVKPGPMPPSDRRYLVPAPSKMLIPRGGHLNGLGDALTDAANAIASGVQTGQVPPSAINQAISSVISAVTGQPATAPVTTASVAKAAIPVGMIALLAGAAWLMTKGGGKKYKRNPSRRRSSRGRRGGGGFDVKTALLWGGGGLAAYYLLLRPGATLLPSSLTAPKPAASPVNAAQQAAIAAGIKSAPSIFDSIAKLFGGGSSTPSVTTSTSTSGAQPVPGIVTSLPEYSPSSSQSSEFVTDLNAA